MDSLTTIAHALMLPFALLAAADGLYFHLWRDRLHARPDSRREHLLHTLRSILFVAILLALFAADRSGPALWGALALVAADTGLELWDVWEEPASRKGLGGLTAAESTLHAALISIRSTSIALLLAAKPVGAWAWTQPAATAPSYGALAEAIVCLVAPGAAAVALLHVWLACRAAPIAGRDGIPEAAMPAGGR